VATSGAEHTTRVGMRRKLLRRAGGTKAGSLLALLLRHGDAGETRYEYPIFR